MTGDRYLTVAEAAEELFVTEKTIRRWIERGLLGWTRTRFLSERDLLAVEVATRRKSREAAIVALNGADGASCAASTRIPKPCRSVTSVQI